VATGATGSTLSVSGERFTYTTGRSGRNSSILKEGASTTTLNQSGRSSTLSGDRLLYQSRISTGTTLLIPWSLRDLRTGQTTDLPNALDYDLWGDRLARIDADGSVWVSNLRTSAAPVKVRDATPADSLSGTVQIAGDTVAWNVTIGTGPQGSYTVETKQRNLETMTAASDLAGIDSLMDLSTGYAAGWACPPNDGCHTVVVSLETGQATPIGETGIPVVDGNLLAFVSTAGQPTVRELATYADAPRLLATPGAPSSLAIGSTTPWSIRVVSSRVLTACTLEIRDAASTIVRSLPCTSPHAAATVTWDGKDATGAVVANGSYAWRIVGATGPASLVDYDGSTTALGGTVTVSGGTTGGPTVTAQGPGAGGTSAPVATNVTATFSQPVTGVSGTTFRLRNAAGTLVGAAVSYNATTRTATLNPSANLVPDTRYTATLTGGTTAIRSTTNVPLATTTWTFTTGPAPTVSTRTPAVNGTSVAVAANVTARFSEPVQGVGTTTFALRDPGGATVPAAVSYNATTRTATLNPSANLAADTRYTATLTGGTTAIRDRAGNPVATSTWSFTTGPAPTVTARTPASGATGVLRASNVTATFNEAVQGVGTASVVLTNGAGARIAAAVTYNPTTRVVTLDPSATLAGGTRYTVTLSGGATGIRDLAGNPIATTRWSFTTGSR
jgi:hypothetical protein